MISTAWLPVRILICPGFLLGSSKNAMYGLTGTHPQKMLDFLDEVSLVHLAANLVRMTSYQEPTRATPQNTRSVAMLILASSFLDGPNDGFLSSETIQPPRTPKKKSSVAFSNVEHVSCRVFMPRSSDDRRFVLQISRTCRNLSKDQSHPTLYASVTYNSESLPYFQWYKRTSPINNA